MKKDILGRLITNSVMIEPHELETVMFFVCRGEEIELIKPSNTPLNKNADFMMNGKVWEMKCPMGKSLLTVEHLFRKAVRQSENVVFDLRHFRGDKKEAIKLLEKVFRLSRRARRMYVISDEKMVEFS